MSTTLAVSHPPLRPKLPDQRWQIAPPNPALAEELAQVTGISLLLAQVLINRKICDRDQAQAFLKPESQFLASPLAEFDQLPLTLELLINAINQRHKIAICGDYDADGMTSTALLMRALRSLGAQVDYAIPSRMSEGYGINERIVEEFYEEGVRLLLTVDNGIAAYAPIARARELGITVIITDHHDLPPELPPANAILNPKLIPETSPYRGLAGVGVAYVLARSLAQSMGNPADLGTSLLELFTLGTIADLAPLTGVNRRWVKQGLQSLPKSKLAGVQALIQVAGLSHEKNLKPEAIGFRLGPRINAVGRLADPQIVIELLTTDDPGTALERAMQCEQINQQRQKLCEQIEQEAIALCEAEMDAVGDRVLLLTNEGWHHGVIGIVASRLVERYGVPVFISTYEDETQNHIRGSARGIPEFNVFDALEYCKDFLEKHGGHRAAGGFSLKSDNVQALRSQLREFCHQCLEPEHLKPLVRVDAETNLNAIDFALYTELEALQPCGIENSEPVFWSANVRVHEQKLFGKGHLKLTVSQDRDDDLPPRKFQVVAWRWGSYYPVPSRLDIAYRLKRSDWNGEISLELELVGVRAATTSSDRADFVYGDRCYSCRLVEVDNGKQLRLRNAQGQVLVLQQGQRIGILHKSANESLEVDVSQPHYYNLIKAALNALGMEQILNE
ncbi:MAG: single-stranded-DNA-specific exonuclease RecJ [Leptolyngbyaceae cyanobacterium bins.349]|nr:single-stranded-DNA-specific exonuclease RecJ [Leptolyngbyaceae cyanobacterium bins.349]